MKRKFKLDNASLAYTNSNTKDWSATFRCGAVMTEQIDPALLRNAVSALKDRFPTFYVQLRRGVIWDYLESVEDTNIVHEEYGSICAPLAVGTGSKPMFRVLYYKNRIAVEFFHCITDGSGALIYLKTLIAKYLTLQGHPIEFSDGVLDPLAPPSYEEIEDSYKKIATREKGVSRREPNAYQYMPKIEDDNLYVLNGLMPIDQLKQVTKALGVTVNEYLVSVYIYSFYQNMEEKDRAGKPIRISVPANLRPLFGSKTLRNFAMYNNVGLPARKEPYTFDEILSYTATHLRAGFQKETLRRGVCKNVADENMLISQVAPAFLKRPFINAGFHMFGENKYTSPFSNLGLVKVPKSMEPFVERFDFIIGRTVKNKIYATAVSFKNTLNVTFSSTSPLAAVQTTFFQFIRSQGVDVKAEYCLLDTKGNHKKPGKPASVGGTAPDKEDDLFGNLVFAFALKRRHRADAK